MHKILRAKSLSSRLAHPAGRLSDSCRRLLAKLSGQPTPGSAPAPTHAQSLSRADRRSLRAFAAVALAFAALMGFSATAQAQTDVWSATLTVAESAVAGSFGYDAIDDTAITGALTDTNFEHQSTTYTITAILHTTASDSLDVYLTPALGVNSANLVLHVGSGSFNFSAATSTSLGANTSYTWSSAGLSWSAGDSVAASIKLNTVPGAPVLTATANGQTQIDLSWTVPDTGGRSLDKYSIDVSADGGTTWAPLADTSATITTHSHTGLTGGTTRHYRVAAVNTIGTGAWSNVDSATTATAANNAPVFTDGTSTTRSVAENTASSRNIGTAIAATDADSGDTLRYTLGGTDMASFAIVSTSGQLQTKAALDYETKSSYAVTISVSDGNGGSDSIDVTVTVTNVDEAGTVTLSAAQPVVDTALTAALTDPDGSLFGVSWVWHKSADLNTWGSAITGAVSASYTPVADDVGQYLRATASYTDGEVSGGTKSAQAVSANAVAAAGNNPATGNPFITGLPTPQVGQSLSASVGNINDADGTTNVVVSYQWIRVDGATETDITGATTNTYTPVAGDVGKQLKVRASFTDDLGNPESRTSAATLAVQAAGNNAPEFTEGTSTTRSVAENTASSRNIGAAVAATDADGGDTLRYTLGGTDMASFAIVSTSGQLQTRAALDFETKSSYAVTVSVSDGNGGTDSIGVTITVMDVAEKPATPGAPTVSATAGSTTSLDVSWTAPGLNGGPAITGYNLQYRQGTTGSFTNGPQNVSGTSAMITGLTAGTSYQVQVRALNGETPSDWSPAGTGSTSSTAQPTLTLEVGPNRFSEAAGSVQICVVPSAVSSQRITVQVATADGTATAPGDYVSHSGTVALQPQQQRACFTVTLVDDAETEGDETFTVTLSNPVNATLGGARASVAFTIVDNDGGANVAPTFTEGTSTTRSVAENTPSGANIGAPVAATDADSGDTLEYTLGGTDFKSFGIHLNTGQLLTHAALDFETKSSYAVSISVSDGNGGTDSIEVAITVTDVDESDGDGDDGEDDDDRPRTSAPGAVRDLTVAGGDGQVVLTWRAPSSDGGAEITDYEYRINRRNPWISTGSTDTTHTVTGLDNGTAYVFQVRAVNRIGKGRTSNRADAAPGGGLGFAHFANGDGTTSDLVFVNVAPQPVRPALYFYDTAGDPITAESVVDITGDLTVQEDGALSVLTDMEPLGVLTISTHGQGELVSGSVKVVANGPIGGMLRFDLPGIGEAVVGASQPVRDVLFPVRRQEGGITTGVAIHNLEAEAMEVVCQLMREGVLRDAVSIPLEANGQTSWLIDAAFPAADTSDFAGSVHCDAPGRRRFSAVALEVDPGARVFITLPLFPVDRGGGGPEAALDFAHFANGDGTTSDLVFVNMKTQPSGPAPTPFHVAIPPIRPVLYFYDTEGNPIAAESVVDVTGDLEITEDGGLTVLTEMEPLGVLTVSTHGQGPLVTGSVRVLSNGPIGGMLRYDLPHIGVAVVEASSPISDAIFPVRRQEGGITTGVAIHNLESSPALVRCDLLREGVLRDAASFEPSVVEASRVSLVVVS